MLDDDKICVGCFRTLDEIKRWNITTSADRVGIIKNANGRKHIAQDSDKDIEDA